MGDDFREHREHQKARRDEIGIDCPGCRKKEPKRTPTRLMPGRKCKVCGTTYAQARSKP